MRKPRLDTLVCGHNTKINQTHSSVAGQQKAQTTAAPEARARAQQRQQNADSTRQHKQRPTGHARARQRRQNADSTRQHKQRPTHKRPTRVPTQLLTAALRRAHQRALGGRRERGGGAQRVRGVGRVAAALPLSAHSAQQRVVGGVREQQQRAVCAGVRAARLDPCSGVNAPSACSRPRVRKSRSSAASSASDAAAIAAVWSAR